MRSRPLLLAGLLVSACVTVDNLQSKLRETTAEYNRGIRWGDIDRAAEHLPAESQQAFLDQYEMVKEDLVIVDYEMTRLDYDTTTGVATSRARIDWHMDRVLVVKTTEIDQTWQFYDGRFVLVDERRSGGDPLAIFAEAAENPHPWLPGLETFRKRHQIGEENDPKAARRGKRRGAPAPTVAGRAPDAS